MLKNYLKIAFRNLLKNKAFSLLNITGLSIGMASAVLILLWIHNESSFDQFHKNGKNIYVAWNRGTINDGVQCWSTTPKILGLTIKKNYPEAQDVVRTLNGWFVTISGEKKFSSEYLIADPGFLNMFSFPLIRGNPNTALNSVYSIVITEKMARRMFGSEDAMNKQIRIDSNNFTVSGVLKDLPINTDFHFDYILPFSLMRKLGWDDNLWGNNSVTTFVQLKLTANFEALNDKIKTISQKHSNGVVKEEIFLYPLTKIHLYSNFENGKPSGGEIETVRLFIVIASFILLIACINFMNLSTARSEKRAKEVGIRKVSGAYRSALVFQFLGESLFISILSGILALLIVQIALPFFNQVINQNLRVPYDSPIFWFSILIFILLTGMLAGSYPAFFLSSFKPVNVLKGKFKNAQSLVTPRRLLVVVQFSFAIMLIIGTLCIQKQILFAQHRDTGYDQHSLVYHFTTGDLKKNYPLVKNELLQSGVATLVNRTSWPLTEIWSDTWDIKWEGKDPNDKTDFHRFSTDENLVRTAGLTLIAGRDMDLQKFPTDSNAAILNEAAVKTMHFKNPIGQIIDDNGQKFHVIGVVKNFILTSPFFPVAPMAIQGAAANTGLNVINIKLAPGNLPTQIEAIGKILNKYNPEYPYEYHFVDEQYALKFSDTRRIGTLAGLFAGLTIFISCLGLFGLASFMAVQRTKEIGVRKVLGASVFSLWQLLSKDFVILVFISLAIAIPVAFFVMHGWLDNFQYRTDISWWLFALAGLSALVITLFTVSFQTLKAAHSNPVKSLRTE